MFKKWYMSFTLAILMYSSAASGMVTLKNGAKENQTLVNQTMGHLQLLQGECALYLSELVRKAKEQQPDIEMHPEVQSALVKKGFLKANGEIPESIKNILLSAAVGSGLLLELVDPILKSNL